jgi:hypothetical protein
MLATAIFGERRAGELLRTASKGSSSSGGSPEDPPVFHRRIIGSCCHCVVDHVRSDEANFLAHLRERRRARIVGSLLAQGAVLVAVLASGWWGVSALGAHAVASEASRRPVYVAGCPVGEHT